MGFLSMAAATFEIQGLAEQVEKLRGLMSDDPDFRRRVNAVIRKILQVARKDIMESATDVMDTDPRHAYKAVRSAVYKRLLGGQVNILAKRRAGTPTAYQKPRKGLPKRGGNRWGRSARTKAMEGYEGTDRGFILRFINAGTEDRAIRSYTAKDGNSYDLRTASAMNIKTKSFAANRGRIAQRNWFGGASHAALEKASQDMQDLIDRIINEEFR